MALGYQITGETPQRKLHNKVWNYEINIEAWGFELFSQVPSSPMHERYTEKFLRIP